MGKRGPPVVVGPTRTIGVRMPEPMLEALDSYRANVGATRAGMVKRMVVDALAQAGKRKELKRRGAAMRGTPLLK